MTEKPSLTITRRIKATPAKIYAAWTDPAKMKAWWGPNETILAETDVRVGGRFRVVTRASDGGNNDVSGVYREVVPERKLVFSWAWQSTPERESLVTVALRPDGDATVMTLTHEKFFDEAARDNHQVGWTMVLDALERSFDPAAAHKQEARTL